MKVEKCLTFKYSSFASLPLPLCRTGEHPVAAYVVDHRRLLCRQVASCLPASTVAMLKERIVADWPKVVGANLVVDAVHFRQWSFQHYGVDIGRKKKVAAQKDNPEEYLNKSDVNEIFIAILTL
ncbi:hypothetical protein L1049_006839 [Liquidambar formosana]|uniref:Uncharacterized protein n=1 Tax=Liquidambar formosana TaxID=63359 RepID=A0AAP0WRW5_LIQFO